MEYNYLEDKLSGKTLLEASAGTGKTFSVTMLALRLIIEKGIRVQQILLVTFTKVASAEMKKRLREFLIIAREIRLTNQSDHKNKKDVKKLLDTAKENGTSDEELKSRLNIAFLELDNLQVFTIHSFLHQMLQEFAFETHQRFSAELVNDEAEIIEECVKNFWRKEISAKSEEELLPLIEPVDPEGFSSIIRPLEFKAFKELVVSLTKGKEITLEHYSKEELNWSDVESIISLKNRSLQNEIKPIQIDKLKLVEEFNAEISSKKSELWEFLQSNNKNLLVSINPEHLKFTSAKRKNNIKERWGPSSTLFDGSYKGKVLEEYNTLISDHKELIDKIIISKLDQIKNDTICEKSKLLIKGTNGVNYIINSLAHQCYRHIRDELKTLKEEQNLKTNDDLINNFFELAQDKEKSKQIKEVLKNRYKAFFIDEFQDTDSKQSDIFSELFDDDTIQFFVGDPKQSIYQFRGANLDSYLSFKKLLKEGGGTIAHLTTNYRSTASFINDCNKYFSDKNFFLKDGINYEEITANSKHTTGEINFIPEAEQSLEKLLLYLLKEKKLWDDEQQKEIDISPKDIAIICRINKECADAKKQLSKIGVPAVVLNDKNIFESNEAKSMITFCNLITEEKNEYNLRKLLVGPWFNFSLEEIKSLDSDRIAQKISDLLTVYRDKGFYKCFQTFRDSFHLNHFIQNAPYPERTITNTEQLLEICHQWIVNEKLSVFSIGKRIYELGENAESENETYQERVESDESCVQIMNMHKAKGLEFKVVISFSLPLGHGLQYKNDSFYEVRKNDQNYLFTTYFSKDDWPDFNEIASQIKREENKRLEYVTITRAKNFFYGIVSSEEIETYEAFRMDETELATINSMDISAGYQNDSAEQKEGDNIPESDMITNKNKLAYSVSSFSNITVSGKHLHIDQAEEGSYPSDYDEFIFKKLFKGALAGNLIHELFEHFDFDEAKNNFDEALLNSVERAQKRYPDFLINKDNLIHFQTLVRNVLESKIKLPGLEDFTLKDLTNDKRMCELDFHMDLTKERLQYEELNTAFKQSSDNRVVSLKYEFPQKEDGVGYLKGFVDFIFEHNGKYYILDWKSNHLGYSKEVYEQERMEKAMQANNYHLQHYIYKKAFIKYLTSVKEISLEEAEQEFGGVIYCFVRGCRENENVGMYVYQKK